MNWVLRLNSIQHAETYQGLGACESPRWDAPVVRCWGSPCESAGSGCCPVRARWHVRKYVRARAGWGWLGPVDERGGNRLCEGGGRAEGRRRSHLGLCMATRSRWSDLLVKSVNRRDPGCEFPRTERRAWCPVLSPAMGGAGPCWRGSGRGPGSTGYVSSRWGGRR